MTKKSASFDPTMAWVAVVIGAVSLFWYFKRRQPPRSNVATSSAPKDKSLSAADAIQAGIGQRWKVALTWDAVEGLSTLERQSLLKKLCLMSDLMILARCTGSDADQLLSEVRELGCLERHKVLLCSTEKGLEAFCRQLIPTLLVSTKTDLCGLLMRFVPWVAHVGPKPSLLGKNVLDIATLDSLPLVRA